ncbi:unnamed protein product [Allacma fusca]|uniref:CRAL-TRIO domain-containing protein n=1 Tax=Allacma fusca TaxID=39272 RepID=A0A8J2JIT0_9HEXA|nr:unnamed protein product [Allacma fusca]
MYYIIYLVISLWGISTATASNLTDAEILAYDSPPIVQENFPYYLSGYDEDGAPIWVFELGKWDVRTFLEKDNETAFAMDVACDQMLLRFKESAINSQAKQFLYICDMDKYSLRQASHLRTVQFVLSKLSMDSQRQLLMGPRLAIGTSSAGSVGKQYRRVRL